MPQISQLFLIAGKRGYGIESAALGTAGAEAEFEDAIRQLSAAVKETYLRVQVIQEHLVVDRKIKNRLENLIHETSMDPQMKIVERKRIRLELLAVKAEREVMKDLRDLGEASLDLRILLGLGPEVKLELLTPLVYTQFDLVPIKNRQRHAKADIILLLIVRPLRSLKHDPRSDRHIRILESFGQFEFRFPPIRQ